MLNYSLTDGLIVKTAATCRIKGRKRPGIPTLIWSNGIDEAASDYLRAIVLEYGSTTSSSLEYAKILRPFLRECRREDRDWRTVDDDFLILWRNHLREQKGLSIGRTNTCLSIIFSFYRWAELTKRIRFQVGIYTEDELPLALKGFAFPISAERKFSRGAHGRVSGRWTTPLTLSNRSQSSRLRHTPTEEQIRTLHEVASRREQGDRDSLMLSWAEETGARRSEILQIRVSQLPTDEQLDYLIMHDEPCPIQVNRKRESTKPLNPIPDLLIRTWDYVNIARREIVERCRASIVGYCEPDEVFLSSTTGLVLHPDSVTSISRALFQEAGVKGASIHRLRAKFAVNIIETLVEAIFEDETIGPDSIWVETILVKASEMMGHSSPRSLRPYLTYVLNRRIKWAKASRHRQLEARLRQLELLVRTMENRRDALTRKAVAKAD